MILASRINSCGSLANRELRLGSSRWIREAHVALKVRVRGWNSGGVAQAFQAAVMLGLSGFRVPRQG